MTTWGQVSSLPFFIAVPSLASESSESPVSLRNLCALRSERGRLASQLDPSRCSTSSVRMTRWGAPSMRVDTTVPVTGVARYWALTSSGTRLSVVSRKRVPMAIPSAPRAMAATRPAPLDQPPAEMTGICSPTAWATSGVSSEVGTTPVWPPPSAPWAITAETPMPAIFSAWRRAPTVGMTTRPLSRQ